MTGLAIAGIGLALLAAGTPASPAESAIRQNPATSSVAEAGHPLDRGNSRNRGNFWNKGKSVNSGNFANVIGSYKSNNAYEGSQNNVNGSQHIIVRSNK
ncbi:hypothetical protein [Nonomuraea sp. C10]|uniref:hypothetical protein n=1 Tax=Nonomuraea sp. C10 TaxID=2600577 RepID=UPI0011CE0852|nr:hypothetical protein [Nonomuraea sp. C10]TXK42084.1 hypothetical protein FR742_23190 [Nonomuraea sp. C10]